GGGREAPFTYLTAAGVWSAMTLAMMAPALGPPLDHVWRSSPRRYRLVALVTFLTAYLLVWIAAGIGVVTASAFLAARMAPSHLALAALAVMLAWQLSPSKQACLNRCHQLMPLAPFGLEAVADQATFGMRVGLWCAGSCWALMLAMLVATAGHWAFMLAASVLIFFERQLPARPARWATVLRS
ncbi:MAG TPA: DUF2182 domain-containing protein, partial [Variovorax sp.]|nr:DUF2182 domain-containing protein [Variovorax sp.]